MNSIAFAVIVLVVLGLAGGIILVLASKFMAVYEDPRIAQITECLAGANCGGCGYAGCADYAKAIVENGAPTNKCAPGGAKATEAVNAIKGTESASGPALHAVVNCNGGNGNCGTRFEYHGIPTCAAAAALIPNTPATRRPFRFRRSHRAEIAREWSRRGSAPAAARC